MGEYLMEKLEIQEYNLNIKLDGVVNIIGLPASGKTYLLKKTNKQNTINGYIHRWPKYKKSTTRLSTKKYCSSL